MRPNLRTGLFPAQLVPMPRLKGIKFCFRSPPPLRVGMLVFGYNPDWKQGIAVGIRNNQNPVQVLHDPEEVLLVRWENLIRLPLVPPTACTR